MIRQLITALSLSLGLVLHLHAAQFTAGQGQLPSIESPKPPQAIEQPQAQATPPADFKVETKAGRWSANFAQGQGRLQNPLPQVLMAAPASTEINPKRWLELMQSQGKMLNVAREKAAIVQLRPAFDHGRLFISDYFYRLAGQSLAARLSPSQLMAIGELSALFALPQEQHQLLPPHFLRVEGNYSEIMVVDLEQAQLRLYQRQAGAEHQLIRHYFSSYGLSGWDKRIEGDNRTPIGLYFTHWLIPGSALPDLYGYGALPINYPNLWDQYQGRTGHGIWLHGSDPFAGLRFRETTNGCLAVSNEDMAEIVRLLNTRSAPMLILPNIGTQLSDNITDELQQRFDAWLSKNAEQRQSYYDIFAEVPYRIHDADRLRISNQLMVAWQDDGDMVALTNFTDLEDGRHWRQYWRYDSQQGWVIFFEGRVNAFFS